MIRFEDGIELGVARGYSEREWCEADDDDAKCPVVLKESERSHGLIKVAEN